jgi:hypothetical protein
VPQWLGILKNKGVLHGGPAENAGTFFGVCLMARYLENEGAFHGGPAENAGAFFGGCLNGSVS